MHANLEDGAKPKDHSLVSISREEFLERVKSTYFAVQGGLEALSWAKVYHTESFELYAMAGVSVKADGSTSIPSSGYSSSGQEFIIGNIEGQSYWTHIVGGANHSVLKLALSDGNSSFTSIEVKNGHTHIRKGGQESLPRPFANLYIEDMRRVRLVLEPDLKALVMVDFFRDDVVLTDRPIDEATFRRIIDLGK